MYWLDISGLKNVIKEPTCRKGLPSLLDVLITNKPKRLQYSSSIDIGLSDFHNLVCAGTKFHVSKRKRTKIFYRSYKKFDETMFVHALSVAPFHVSEIFDEVDDAYWMCSTLLQEIVNEHAPIKQKTIKGNHLPYMNGELRRAINVKRMLKRKFTKCNSNMNWDKYRKQRNIVTVVPVMNGHPRDQAKVSEHCRWPLVTGTDGQAGDAKYNTPCNTTYYYHHQRYS